MLAGGRSLRIAVCTKHDLFGAIVLAHVLPRLAGHALAVFMSVRERPEADDAVPELDLMRLLERQVPLDLLFPLLERDPAAGGAPTPRQSAARAGAPLTLLHDMAPEGGVRAIEAFQPDVVLSIRFSYLFRRSTIAMAAGGILNVHPGPLPEYRGLYAPFWQLMRGESALRCTVHLVDAGVDTGPVLSIVTVPIEPGRSLIAHAARLYLAGADRALEHLRTGLPTPVPQDPARARHCAFPTPEEFAAFRARGHALVRGADYRALLLPFLGDAGGRAGA